MAFPSAPSVFLSISLLTVLFATAARGSTDFDEDPLQPVTSDETVSAGGTVMLTCQVTENDNSSLQWSNTAQQTLYFGEKRALRDNRIQLHRSTPTELSITIADVQLSDEGEYTCSLFTMPVRTARATVTVLGVPSKPQLSGFEEPVMEGTSVTLTCSSTGSKPPAKLHWYREDQELPGGADVVESDPNDPTYKVSSKLTLEVSRNDDNSYITCAVDHATLTSGNKKSAQALRVLYPPNVQVLPSSDLPREGERFNLQCLGNSNPEPTSYIWEKKDGELPPLAKVDGAFLHFEMLNKSDNGVYLCTAENGIGNNEEEYTLRVQVDAASPALDYFTDPTLLPSPSSSSSSSSLGSDPSSVTSSGSDPTSSSSSPGSDPTSSSSSPGSDPSSSSASTAPSFLDSAYSLAGMGTTLYEFSTTTLSNVLFPDLPLIPDFISSLPTPTASTATPPSSRSAFTITPSVSIRLNGVYTFTDAADYIADPTAMSSPSGVDHAVIGGVVAVIVFILLCLLIIFGRYLIRHKGTYLTHEAKGSDDAPDADTAIINAEGGTSGGEDKKEYFI